jgi:DNA-binding GntR family transcriptional regulator
MLRYMSGGQVPPFDPGAGGPAYVYVLVADHIAARISAGELAPGSRLPAERDLAAEYDVAVGTARRAVEELRGRGLVVTLPAKGTFVAGQTDAPSPGGESDGASSEGV